MKPYVASSVFAFAFLALTALNGCSDAGAEDPSGAAESSLTVTLDDLGPALDNPFAALAQTLVYFRSGFIGPVELVASNGGSAPTVIFSAPAARFGAVVAYQGRAYTIIAPVGTSQFELLSTDGTVANTKRIPLSQGSGSLDQRSLSVCGDSLLFRDRRINVQTGTLTQWPSIPDFYARESHCVDGEQIVGMDRETPLARRHYRWEPAGNLTLLSDDSSAHTYLSRSSSIVDQPIRIGNRLMLSPYDLLTPAQIAAMTNDDMYNWMERFRPIKIVKPPTGAPQLVFSMTYPNDDECLGITNGTPAGTKIIRSSCDWRVSPIYGAGFAGGKVLGQAFDGLFRSDGTVKGTKLEAIPLLAAMDFDVASIASIGGKALFLGRINRIDRSSRTPFAKNTLNMVVSDGTLLGTRSLGLNIPWPTIGRMDGWSSQEKLVPFQEGVVFLGARGIGMRMNRVARW
jgi:hypothetical protein